MVQARPKSEIPSTTPPSHSIAFVLLVLALCLASAPNILSTIDDAATIKTCSTPLFPEIISRATLGWIRVAFAGFIGIVSIYRLTETEVLEINYLKDSKLIALPIDVSGLRSQLAFTSWCWNLLGVSFAISGLLALYIEEQSQHYTYEEINAFPHMKVFLRACILTFEMAAPLSMLVSFVVTYVLWPIGLKGKGTDGCKRIPVLIQHNANVIMSLVELGLLGGLPVRFTDLPLAPMFGVVFIFFSWSARFMWHPSGEPQFLYFFLDTTLGKTTTIALAGLVVILIVFYAIFVVIDDILLLLGGGLVVHAGVVAVISMLVCRFRD